MFSQVKTTTVAALVTDADGISASQTPAAGGVQNLTIAGDLASDGAVTLTAAQLVTITTNDDETARTFTVTGTDADGEDISEDVTGVNNTTVDTTKFFKTITQVAVDDDTTAAVTVGVDATNGGVSPSLEVSLNEHGDDYKGLLEAALNGAATYSLQGTFDDVNGTYAEGISVDGNWIDITGFTGKTASFAGLAPLPVRAVRVKKTAHTSGSVVLTVVSREPTGV